MSDLKKAMPLTGAATIAYLSLVLMLVFVEVRTGTPIASSIAFYALTIFYAIATTSIHWRKISSKPVALVSALAVISVMFLVAIVAGVNAKFWMGGTL